MFSPSRLRVPTRVPPLLISRKVHQFFQYTRAVIGSVNDRFATGAIRFEEPQTPIDVEKARAHHSNYVKHLRKTLPGKIFQIPADSRFPDQVFTEDPAVVYDGTALLTRMRAPSRSGEKDAMKHALEEMGFNNIHEMRNPAAYLDGGDVLFTGREFLVGLSTRTNKVAIYS